MDFARLVGAVTRELSSREKDGKLARVIVATRTYDTAREDVWDALTNPERIPRWFLPVSGELEPGGHYQFEGNAGGEILTCDAPEHLGVTWVMHGAPSWVDVTLTALSASTTELRLEHVAHVPDEFWAQFGPGAVGVGWDQALVGLERYLAEGVAFEASKVQDWIASPDGHKFTEGSSAGWAEASIAAGTDPQLARASQARTTAFYTGQPQPEDPEQS